MQRELIIDRLFERAERTPHELALVQHRGGQRQELTWARYAERVRHFAAGLIALGHREGQPLAILGYNSAEWMIADLAAMAAGGASAGVYVTSSPDEVRHMVRHSGAFAIVCENGERWRTQVRPAIGDLASVQHVILIEPDASIDDRRVASFEEVEALGRAAGAARLEARLRRLAPERLGSLIYTSGTTGPPKAVMLSHDNIAWTAAVGRDVLAVGPHDAVVSYLPLSHIAERMFSVYIPVSSGMRVQVAPSIDKVRDALSEARPTIFMAVPRVWEKVQARVQRELNRLTGPRAALLRWARRVGLAAGHATLEGGRLRGWSRLRLWVAGALVLGRVRRSLGFDRLRYPVSLAAPIGADVLRFFLSLGIPIHEIYGQSEVTGPTTLNLPGAARHGTVGRPFPEVQVKLAPDGEVLVRGRNVFIGYLNDDAATRAALREGWLHSGDVGRFDADGYLRLTDRKKDLIVTAGGKNIAPQNLEAMLQRIPLVEHAVCIGDRRKYVSALLTLDTENAAAWARRHGADATEPDALARHPDLLSELQRSIDEINRGLSRAERIRRFRVLPETFSPASGVLTPTLKVRRRVVERRYARQIERLYAA